MPERTVRELASRTREISDWVERDRREPDKLLCHVEALRRAALDAELALEDLEHPHRRANDDPIPSRRATDPPGSSLRHLPTTFGRWWRLYGRDVWMLLTTIGVVWTLSLYKADSDRTSRQSYQACRRAQVAIPLIAQALVRTHALPMEDVLAYKASRPKSCHR